jgi:galactose mutarotase-like enzyme
MSARGASLKPPHSIGSHYNYMVPIDKKKTLEDYEIDFGFPQSAGRLVFSDGFITGKTKDIFNGSRSLRLGNLFASGAIAIALADLSTDTVTLCGIKSGHFTEIGMSNFDHLLLWAPSDTAPFVCMEAWAGLPDRIGHNKQLENKDAIRILTPGMEHTYSQHIKIG